MISRKRLLMVWCAASVVPILLGAPRAEGGVLLAESGKTRTVIVLREGSEQRAIERAAANLLQSLLGRMSGAEPLLMTETDLGDAVDVRDGRLTVPADHPAAGMSFILVGMEELAGRLGVATGQIGPGGLHLETFENGVVLLGGPATVEGEAGSDGNGVQHAAIELLERLGCRYLWPGRTGMVVPNRPTLELAPMRCTYTPQIRHRNIRTSFGGDRAESGLAQLGLIDEHLRDARAQASEGAPPIGWNTWQRLGGSMPSFGHAGGGLRGGDRYLETNPEWFAMQADGTRDQGGDERWRLCVSNPELIAHVAADIIEYRNANPGLELFSLDPNDGGSRTGWCRCDACRALDPENAPMVKTVVFPSTDRSIRETREVRSMTDRMVTYWNRIAERVTQVHPDLLFGISAYSVHQHPPVERTLHPNLVVRYVPSSIEFVEGWRKAGAKRMFWRPNILLANRRHGKLRSIVAPLCEAMNYFGKAGIVQTDFDSNLGNWATLGLSYYAAARLNWNPYLDADTIIKDFAQAGFGDGAEAIIAFFNRVEKTAPTLEDIPWLRAKLNEAETAADDPAVSERIAFLRLGLNWTHLHEQLAEMSRRANEREAVDRELARRLVDLNCLAVRDIVLNHHHAVNVSYVLWGSGTFAAYAPIGGRTVRPSDKALIERVRGLENIHPELTSETSLMQNAADDSDAGDTPALDALVEELAEAEAGGGQGSSYGWTGREDSLDEMLKAFGL